MSLAISDHEDLVNLHAKLLDERTESLKHLSQRIAKINDHFSTKQAGVPVGGIPVGSAQDPTGPRSAQDPTGPSNASSPENQDMQTTFSNPIEDQDRVILLEAFFMSSLIQFDSLAYVTEDALRTTYQNWLAGQNVRFQARDWFSPILTRVLIRKGLKITFERLHDNMGYYSRFRRIIRGIRLI